MTDKTCTKCKQTKPATDFNAKARAKDGLQTWCRACMSVSNREAYMRRKAPIVA